LSKALDAAIAAGVVLSFCCGALPARAQFSERPVTPGFWTFPRQKTVTPKDITAACREHFEVQFADGRFFGVKILKTEKSGIQRIIDEVGRCAFNRDTQVDRCDMKVIRLDGSLLAGTVENKYSSDADKTLKVTITPKLITDTPFSNTPYDAFPARCPDDGVWDALNEVAGVR